LYIAPAFACAEKEKQRSKANADPARENLLMVPRVLLAAGRAGPPFQKMPVLLVPYLPADGVKGLKSGQRRFLQLAFGGFVPVS